LETDVRDGALAVIRLSIAADIAAGRSVLVAGDFNTTEREPAYADFVRGLRDAHLDAGIGPGLTWRPLSLDGLPFGLVRIDYLMTTPDLQAVSTHVVCNELSDHCLLEAGFR
jgi:endonuclease/exonuclease/phosphatase family metal-dependent hydrolase